MTRTAVGDEEDGQGRANGRLARQVGLSHEPLHTLRQHLQANIHETALMSVMLGMAFEFQCCIHPWLRTPINVSPDDYYIRASIGAIGPAASVWQVLP